MDENKHASSQPKEAEAPTCDPRLCRTPTAAEINALPDSVRYYIHELETNCDPAGVLREAILSRDTIKGLEAMIADLRGQPAQHVLTQAKDDRDARCTKVTCSCGWTTSHIFPEIAEGRARRHMGGDG